LGANDEVNSMKATSFVSVAALMLALSLAAPSLADPGQNTPGVAPSSTTTASTTDSAHDPNKIICHTEVPTGSRLGGHKVCRTRAEWADIARDAKDQLDSVSIHADQMNPPGH
jgi:hypothetical protein